MATHHSRQPSLGLRRRFSITYSFVSLALYVSLTACSGTDTSRSDDAQRESGSQSAQTSAPTATTTAPSSATTSPKKVKQVEASALLLTSEDLIGTGWKSSDDTNPAADPSQPISQPICRDQAAALSVPGLADEAHAAWYASTGDEPEAISSAAYVYSDVATAISAMANYRSTAVSCVNWQDGGTGSPYAFSEEQVLFDASAGEETIARELRTSSTAFPDVAPGIVYWVAARNQNIVVQTTYAPNGLLDIGTGRSRTVELAVLSAGKANS